MNGAASIVKEQRGFTLIEVLIGLVLLSIMLSLLFGSIRMGARIWEAGETRAAELDRILVVQNFLRRQLTTVRPILDDLNSGEATFSFSGSADSLQFVSDLPSSAHRKGLHLFNLELADDDDSNVLIVKLKAFYPPLDGAEAAIEDVRLISGVDSVVYSYFGVEDFTEKPADGRWTEEWQDKEFLPFLIKIEIHMQNGRDWPALLVEPKLSASEESLNGLSDGPFD